MSGSAPLTRLADLTLAATHALVQLRRLELQALLLPDGALDLRSPLAIVADDLQTAIINACGTIPEEYELLDEMTRRGPEHEDAAA